MNARIENFEIFPNAPIKEAVFDIGIEPLSEDRVKELESLHSKFSEIYPDLKPIQATRKIFAVHPDVPPPPKEHALHTWVHGYQMWASDKKSLVTCRQTGFSYNKLKPYVDGEDAINKVIAGWKIFQNEITEIKINKLSVRNINVIDIPESRFEVDDYIRLSPAIPDELGDVVMRGFFVNTALYFTQEDASCGVTLTPQPVSSGASLLLDIVAEKKCSDSLNETQIRTELNSLKDIKDKVFFSLITDKCKELFR